MTERGIPVQIAADMNRIQKPLTFQPQTSKFKSAFGDKDGSQINSKQPFPTSFHETQAIDAARFGSVPGGAGVVQDGPRHLAQRFAAALLQPRLHQLHHSQEL